MIRTSSAYQTAVKGDTRKTLPLVMAELNSALEGYPFATATATSEQAGYEASQAVNGRIRETAYTSTVYLPSQLWPVHYGWWSSALSNGSGVLSAPQVLDITYTASINCKNFFLVAPSTNYPTAFSISVSPDGSTWQTVCTETANAECLYSYRAPAEITFQYCRVTITAISAASSPVKVLQAGAVTTVVFELYDADVMKFTEELGIPASSSPLALVSSNVIEFAISNEAKLTDQDNTSSFFYGLLGKNFRFRAFLGVRTVESPEQYEWMPCGVWWNVVSEQTTNEIVSSFMGYDRLSVLKDEQVPVLSIQADATVYELFDLLLQELGMNRGEYWIDPDLDQPVPAGFFAGQVDSNFSDETVGEVLQVLAEAGCAYVLCDRWGLIRVQSNFLNSDPVEELTDSTYIFSVQKKKEYNQLYDKVRVRYKIPQGLDAEEILFETTLNIPTGGGTPLELEAPDPVGLITRVELNSTNAEVSAFYPGAVRSIIEFSNTGATESATVKVYGQKLKVFNTSLDVTNLDETKETARKILKVSNWLIQDKDTAQTYGDVLLQFSSEPYGQYIINERGNPAREAGDLIEIDDDTNDIAKEVQITKQVITWNGILSAETSTRPAIIQSSWVFVHPGQPALEEITEEKTTYDGFITPVHMVEMRA